MQSNVNASLAAMRRLAERAGARIQADPRDFLPALVRLQEAPPSPLGRRVLAATLIFLVAVLLWAAFGRLDIIAVADGRLVPDTYVKIVQPIDSGVVKEILVKEGEAVKTGQVLMRMDAALSESDLKSLTADDKNKRIALRRIDAQLAGAPFTQRADEPAELFAQVYAQYLANRQAYDNALAQERATLEKAKHDLAAAEQVRKKLAQTLPHYRAQEAAYAKLTKDGFAGSLMFTDKQRERIEHEQDLRAQEEMIASARSTIAQEEKKIAQISAEYRRQLQTERVDIASQLEKADQELAKQEHRQEYLELRAPQDGVVKDLATHTIGTVTSPGTIMMTLVPKDENLRAEVWVKNDDIGFVHTGAAGEDQARHLHLPEVRHGRGRSRACERGLGRPERRPRHAGAGEERRRAARLSHPGEPEAPVPRSRRRKIPPRPRHAGLRRNPPGHAHRARIPAVAGAKGLPRVGARALAACAKRRRRDWQSPGLLARIQIDRQCLPRPELGGQQFPQTRGKGRQLDGYRLPYEFGIDVKVGMDQAIAHSRNRVPGRLG